MSTASLPLLYPNRARIEAAWGGWSIHSGLMRDSDIDEVGFDEFYLRTVKRVIGAIALVTHDLHAAEDAAQEAFSRAADRWDRVGKLERPDLWVIRVGTNTAITSWKRHRREGGLEVERL